jgi:glycosyltransferase involved in cell wall biosynthesis
MDPSDTESVASGITKILSDAFLRESLAAKGLERSSLFNWDLCASKTLELLERVGSN